ncbi:MAG: ribonuclease HII [Flavobacteriales bacterium]
MLKSFHTAGLLEAGCDEAGRGCLAGPVFAAAVSLPPDWHHPVLDDSKKLSEKKRYMLRPLIEKHAVCWAVAFCSPKEIDQMNILRASILAMQRAVRKLPVKPGHLLIDGNRFSGCDGIPFHCIVGGDGLYSSIAAASVLAKTYRDDAMKELHAAFPQYRWDRNKGYPTELHKKAIIAYGTTPHHRRSFKLLPGQQELKF